MGPQSVAGATECKIHPVDAGYSPCAHTEKRLKLP
jgi:hypothetical protein